MTYQVYKGFKVGQLLLYHREEKRAMQLVIDIPVEYYKAIMEIPVNQSTADMLIIRNGTPLPKCNQCKYYEGVHNIQGHAPCSYHNSGGVLWDWYCSQFEADKEELYEGSN